METVSSPPILTGSVDSPPAPDKLFPPNLEKTFPPAMRQVRRYSLPHDDRGGYAGDGKVAAIAKILYEHQQADFSATASTSSPVAPTFPLSPPLNPIVIPRCRQAGILKEEVARLTNPIINLFFGRREAPLPHTEVFDREASPQKTSSASTSLRLSSLFPMYIDGGMATASKSLAPSPPSRHSSVFQSSSCSFSHEAKAIPVPGSHLTLPTNPHILGSSPFTPPEAVLNCELPPVDLSDPGALASIGLRPLPPVYMGYMYGYIKTLKNLFEKHQINYSLTGGCLLGIARFPCLPIGEIHPWDDDVDMAIPKEERHKLYSPDFLKDLKEHGLRIDPHPVFGDKVYSSVDLGFGSYHTKSPTGRYDFPRKSYFIPNVDLFTTRIQPGSNPPIVENSHSEVRRRRPRKFMLAADAYPTVTENIGPIRGVQIPRNPIGFLDTAYPHWREELRARFSHNSEGGVPVSVRISNWGHPNPHAWAPDAVNIFSRKRSQSSHR